jgi:ribosome recycling factor
MDPDTILLQAEEHMDKSIKHLEHEFKGVRTGRATPALIDTVRVDYYGTQTELKSMAAISSPEPTQLLVKPFDAQSVGAIKTAIEQAGLGLNPISEGKQLRVMVPALSQERRKQLSTHVKKVGEEQKVAIRNVRRDANRHADQLKSDKTKHYAEDDLENLKEEIQEMLKKYETKVDTMVESKTKEIMTV